MAKIMVLGEHCRAEISEPDGDGCVTYLATCGMDSSTTWGPRSTADTIAAAEIHVGYCQTPAATLHHPDYE